MVEVAHDFQLQIKNYIANDLRLVNSYDTWHGKCLFVTLNDRVTNHLYLSGTKNVVKNLTNITRGRGIDNIKAQLMDKS